MFRINSYYKSINQIYTFTTRSNLLQRGYLIKNVNTSMKSVISPLNVGTSNNIIIKKPNILHISSIQSQYSTINANKGVTSSIEPPPPNWIRNLHPNIQPYVQLTRIDKPIGIWLLLAPCLWSITLATPIGALPDPLVLAVFTAGSVIMRSAGCVINDMADHKFDAQVERTKSRPLASKRLTHKQSLGFLAAHLSSALGMILVTLNHYSIGLLAASVPVVALYPFMKRFTYYPQAVLGLAFNWGTMAGYSAIAGHCDWSIVLPLYLAGVSWTMVYDTIYAHQDKKDDIIVGIKSTALKFADKSGLILSGFSCLTMLGLTMTGYMASMPWCYYLGMAGAGSHLIWQLKTIDYNNPKDCLSKFKSNRDFSLIVLFTIIISKIYQYLTQQNSTENVERN